MKISTSFGFALCVIIILTIIGSAQTPAANVGLLRIRGIELYREKKYEEAASVLKKAVKFDKADADAWYYLGLALSQNPKSLKDASKAFETTTKLRPGVAAAHISFCVHITITR